MRARTSVKEQRKSLIDLFNKMDNYDLDVNINLTVTIPREELEAIIEEIEDEYRDEDGKMDPDYKLDEDNLNYALADHLESNLDVNYIFGDAWICSIDDVSIM